MSLVATGADQPATMTQKVMHVLLVEHDQIVAQQIVQDFGRAGIIVTVARTLADAREVLRQRGQPVDVVVLEIRFPDGRGESLLPEIEKCPRQPTVIITTTILTEIQLEALEYRPVTMAKPLSSTTLLRMVKTVAAGYTAALLRRFIRSFALSKRQSEVVILLTQGLNVKEIAARLDCNEKTVYAHLAKIYKKVGCGDYHKLLGRLFAFSCQSVGHTPPEPAAFIDRTPANPP